MNALQPCLVFLHGRCFNSSSRQSADSKPMGHYGLLECRLLCICRTVSESIREGAIISDTCWWASPFFNSTSTLLPTQICFVLFILTLLLFLVGLGPFFLILGITFHDGLGVKLQICQDGFLTENERKTCSKPIVSCFPPFGYISFLFSALLFIFLLLLLSFLLLLFSFLLCSLWRYRDLENLWKIFSKGKCKPP
jgi:hypothetical protein